MGGLRVSRQRGSWCAPLVIVALVGCATPAARVDEMQRLQARAAYERGIQSFAEKKAPAALSAFQEAIGLDGAVALYHNALGALYLELRRPDLALEAFRTATKLEPGYADAHLNTGIALAEAERWEEAVAAYRKALALPTLTVPHVARQDLGLALYHLERYAEAEAELRFALSLEPQMVAGYYNLGLVLVAEGRREEAKAAFRTARELGPQSPFGRAAGDRLRDLGDGG